MVALAAEARVIDDTFRLALYEANLDHLASKGLLGEGVEHLSEEINHGGRGGSIVKRSPIIPFPFPLKFPLKFPIKKLGPLGIPLKLLFAACIAGTGGLCAGAGK